MNDPISDYLAENESPSLMPDERAAGRFALQARMALSLTVEEKIDIRRALQRVVYADPAPVSFWAALRLPLRLPAMGVAVMLVLCASGGGFVTFAAEKALPGDALYGVKIHVNEAIRGQFQFSAEARSSWAIARLERRIDELRRLEARGAAEAEIDVAMGPHIERAAAGVEAEFNALPAAAAERAAMRTAVNAAIGDDQDSLRRASRINRVLKALKDRAEGFDAPADAVPAVLPVDLPKKEEPLRVNVGASASVSVGTVVSSRAAASSARSVAPSSAPSRTSSIGAASSVPGAVDPASTSPAPEPEPEPEPEPALPVPSVDAPLQTPSIDVPGTVDGLL